MLDARAEFFSPASLLDAKLTLSKHLMKATLYVKFERNRMHSDRTVNMTQRYCEVSMCSLDATLRGIHRNHIDLRF